MKMKKTAEDYLGVEVTSVITVPAYFNDSQRQATKDAGRIAGLEVRRIINEPTAAALAYGMDKKRGDVRIAVYDLGGGTFDVSIIEIAEVEGEHQFEVLSTNWRYVLGGEDFDLRIMEYLADEFRKSSSGIDLHSDPLALPAAEGGGGEDEDRALLEPADRGQPALYHRRTRAGRSISNIRLTRAKLEALVEELIARTIRPCETALKDAKLNPTDVSDVDPGRPARPACPRSRKWSRAFSAASRAGT